MVELYLAKVVVAGSNPVSRFIPFQEFFGDVPKWLRERPAKPLFAGSTPAVAFNVGG